MPLGFISRNSLSPFLFLVPELEASGALSVHSHVHFHVSDGLESMLGNVRIFKICKFTAIFMLLQILFSFPNLPVLVIFQSPQIAAPCLVFRSYSCTQLERQGVARLIHLSWNQKHDTNFF